MYEKLEDLVLKWAHERGIIENGDPSSQLLKAVSEMGELADAEAKKDFKEMADAVGDILVCLIIYCELRGFSLLSCLDTAYGEIKDRTGRLNANGVFIKE